MSRHRNVRNLNIEEELAEDDDADYYGRSLEEDEPLTPATSKFLYNRRPDLTYAIVEEQRNGDGINDYETNATTADHYGQHAEVFDMDVSGTTSSSSSSKYETPKTTPPKKPTFLLGAPKSTPKASPRGESSKKPAFPPNVESLRVSETKPSRANSKSPARMTPNTSSQRLSSLDVALASTSAHKARVRPANASHSVNLVIVGHVDAGKSTLVGHLLYLLGGVDDRVMHKNRQESSRAGKSSFAFAWILDEGEEERQRGVTMDIARVSFQSPLRADRTYNILDAPGHKDFIPNMITGASQADAALLVINATRGEFETGFDQGGQTREHALLLRSLGVSKVVAAINKLDTIDWSKDRFEEVSAILKLFLQKQAGFDDVKFVPVSGLLGTNLVERPPPDHPLAQWHADGPSLLEALDQLPEPSRWESEPLRVVVNDILRLTTNTLYLTGKVESGFVENGDKLFLMPDANPVTVKSVALDDVSTTNLKQQTPSSQPPQQQNTAAFAGDQILLTLTGSFEPDSVYPGHVLCRGGASELLVPLQRFLARIVVFDIRIPILRGTRAELFAHTMRAPCVITRLRSVLNKATRKVVQNNPRVLTRNMSAMVEIQTELPVNIEPHPKTLCRFTLRANNQTIAAGIVDSPLSA